MANQMKRDPTRTTLLRRQYVADMRRRFKKLAKDIHQLVVVDDAFGLDETIIPTFNVDRQAWRFQTDANKVKSYRRWLKEQVDAGILTPIDGVSGRPWTATYVESAYRKGAIRSFNELNALDAISDDRFFLGGRAQFITDAFTQGEAVQKLETLFTRSFDELTGITDVMGQQMSRIVSTGLSRGSSAAVIARNLQLSVAGISKQRAEVLARTEIIHAHAEGQLDAMEMLGVEEVQADVEWSTAGDERVCPLCDELEGVVMTVKEARGLIPRHPNCRCAWIPALRNRKEKGQLRGRQKTKAIKASIQKEAPTGKRVKRSPAAVRRRSVWVGKEIL